MIKIRRIFDPFLFYSVFAFSSLSLAGLVEITTSNGTILKFPSDQLMTLASGETFPAAKLRAEDILLLPDNQAPDGFRPEIVASIVLPSALVPLVHSLPRTTAVLAMAKFRGAHFIHSFPRAMAKLAIAEFRAGNSDTPQASRLLQQGVFSLLASLPVVLQKVILSRLDRDSRDAMLAVSTHFRDLVKHIRQPIQSGGMGLIDFEMSGFNGEIKSVNNYSIGTDDNHLFLLKSGSSYVLQPWTKSVYYFDSATGVVARLAVSRNPAKLVVTRRFLFVVHPEARIITVIRRESFKIEGTLSFDDVPGEPVINGRRMLVPVGNKFTVLDPWFLAFHSL